jgi:hypothetical protein
MKYSFQNGWMGGKHLINGNVCLDIKKVLSNAYVVINNIKYKIFSEKKSGVDNDHGNEYRWTATRFYILLDTPVMVKAKISLIDLLKNRKSLTVVAE